MKVKDLKTIDLIAKEWFDKLNGNSYFSAILILNYGLKNEKTLNLPFQYGYGSQYESAGSEELKKFFDLKENFTLWRFCENNNIILRSSKEENCLKRDL